MNIALRYLAVLLIIAVILDFLIISGWKKYRKVWHEQKKSGIPINKLKVLKEAFIGNQESPWIQYLKHILANTRLRANLLVAFELSLLALWAINVGWEYLDMDPHVVPTGNEFGSAIQANHLWTQILKCGWCAVWNGFERGGYPAFADIQGSMLHPITMISTLVWGVLNGVKVTLVVSFWVAGLAQWWIARELNLGWLPRMWSAGIAIAGGHLAGRMQLGVSGVILSTAMASLMFAALMRLARTARRKDAIVLGIITASAIISGQGYIQIGLIGILPVAAIFLVTKRNTFAGWENYLIAAGIALLLAAPLLVPLAHFSPNISKFTDPEFESVQPLSYLVLNLVIDDPNYYQTDIMQKFPYPYLYTLYIGWIPVLLAIYALNKSSLEHRKFINFLAIGTLIEFLISSAFLFKWLANIWPAITGIRHPPQIAGLAIPLILGLSAYGLEKLLSLHWMDPLLNFDEKNRSKWKLILQGLLLIPLIFSLQSCFRFSQVWIGTRYLDNDVFKILAKLKTEDLQWVEPPFGEHDYVEPAISMGMKLSPGILTWSWHRRENPQAVLYTVRKGVSLEGIPPGELRKIGTYYGIIYYANDNAHYAGILIKDKIQPCTASGSGGIIQVACNVEQAGKLVVQENMWTGWRAWMDGKPVQLADKERLEVRAPAGKHTFIFRYLPWDVPFGIILFIIGTIISIRLWKLS